MEITNSKDRFTIPGKPAVTMPFASPVSVKKIKSSSQYKKKVQGLWISSTKLSLVYLLSYYMLKADKKRLCGFYPVNGNKYIFFSVIIDGFTVKSQLQYIDDSPKEFLDIEQLSYEVIIGNTKDIETTPMDWDKLYKSLLPSIRPIYMVAGALLVGMLIFLIYELIPNKVEVKPAAPPPRPVLTVLEKNYLQSLMFSKALEDYKKIQDALTTDIAFKEVHITVTPADYTVSYKLNAQISSYYPFTNSKLDSRIYVYPKDTGGSLSKDLEGAKVRLKLRSPYDCLQKLLPYNTTKRDDNSWDVSVKEKNYEKVTKLFKDIYMCPISTDNLKIDDKELSADFKLFTDYKFVEMPPPPQPAK